MPIPVPVHSHDCTVCEFLGHVSDGREDVYQCDHIDLIVRYGSREEENAALPICVVTRNRQDSPRWQAALALYETRYPLSRAVNAS